ncbi:MAG: hypothetical protein NUW23_12485 [Firmicutes bacterium]|nr:hypothetical protein [Bacillota bacterium]
MQLPLVADDADTIRTAISPSYVPTWGIGECLREVLQEGLDLMARGYRVTVGARNGFAIVTDLGPGLRREHLALGQSSKRDEPDLIGNFGEGVKLAALVAARLGRRMRIDSVGFSAEPFIARDPALQCEVLMFRLGPSRRTRGTRIAVEASGKELEEAKSLFLHWHRGRRFGDDRVFLPGGRLYINGALAGKSERWLFSYNVMGQQAAKQAQNRDRTIVDEDFVRRYAKEALENTHSRRIIETLLRAHAREESYLETDLYMYPTSKMWVQTACKIVGPRSKTVMNYDSRTDLEAETHGFAVVRCYGAWRGVLESLGYLTSRNVIERLRAKKMVPARLTPTEAALLKAAITAIGKAYAPPGRVRVTELEDLLSDGDCPTPAIYNPKTDVIWLSRILFRDPSGLLQTLLHETVHKHSGAPDASRDFETALCRLAAALVSRFYCVEETGFWDRACDLVKEQRAKGDSGSSITYCAA